MNVGDQVLLVAGGASVFEIVELDGDHALVQSVDAAPGQYPFTARTAELVPVKPA